jgi:hypothetical protein
MWHRSIKSQGDVLFPLSTCMLLERPIATFQTLRKNMNKIIASTGHFIRIQVLKELRQNIVTIESLTLDIDSN